MELNVNLEDFMNRALVLVVLVLATGCGSALNQQQTEPANDHGCVMCVEDTTNNGMCLDRNGNPVQGDYDCDSVPDIVDNCPWIYNPDQANADGDAYGDVCDNCPNTPNSGWFLLQKNGETCE